MCEEPTSAVGAVDGSSHLCALCGCVSIFQLVPDAGLQLRSPIGDELLAALALTRTPLKITLFGLPGDRWADDRKLTVSLAPGARWPFALGPGDAETSYLADRTVFILPPKVRQKELRRGYRKLAGLTVSY
jgi:hypothetical protein